MSIMNNLQGLLTNPMFGMGVGLLSGGDPGGTLASGGQQGIQNAMLMQQANSRNKLMQLQAQKYQSDQAALEKQRGIVQGMANKLRAPTPYKLGPDELFPGEAATIPGLGMEASPQAMAVADIMEAAPVKYFDELIESKFAGEDAPGFTDIAGLRKEYTKSKGTENFNMSRAAYEKIMSTSPNGPGDLSMIFAYMKMIDPTSVVRESEFKTAAEAGNVPAIIRAYYDRWVENGGKLDVTTRAQFRKEAQTMFKGYTDRQLERENVYGKLAERLKVDKDEITIDVVGPYRNYNWDELPVVANPTFGEVLEEATGLVGDTDVSGIQPPPIVAEPPVAPVRSIGETITLPNGVKARFLGGEDIPDNWEYIK